jgi:hypothetical protein
MGAESYCKECDKRFKFLSDLDQHNFDKHGIKKPNRELPDNGHRTEADYQTWMRL